MKPEIHNLRIAIMNAVKLNDRERLGEACQAVFEAGFELEEMNLMPSVFAAVCDTLLEMKWSPKVRGEE